MSKRKFNYISTLDYGSIKNKSLGRVSRYTKSAIAKSLVGPKETKRALSGNKQNRIHPKKGNKIVDIAVSPLSKSIRKIDKINRYDDSNNIRRSFEEGGILDQTLPPIRETRSTGTPTSPAPWINALLYVSNGQRNGIDWDWLPEPVPCLWPQTDPVTGYPLLSTDEQISGRPEFTIYNYYLYNECVHLLEDTDGDGIITLNDIKTKLCDVEGIMCTAADSCDPILSESACVADNITCGWSTSCPHTWCGSCGNHSSCVSGECVDSCDPENASILTVPGDLNGDGMVNVLDVVSLVNYVLGNIGPMTECQFLSADVNGDGNVDVLDIVSIVNFVLRGSEGIDEGFNPPDLYDEGEETLLEMGCRRIGDVDGDGVVTGSCCDRPSCMDNPAGLHFCDEGNGAAGDAGMILLAMTGQGSTPPPDTFEWWIWDVDGNGYINAHDSSDIQRTLNGSTTVDPVAGGPFAGRSVGDWVCPDDFADYSVQSGRGGMSGHTINTLTSIRDNLTDCIVNTGVSNSCLGVLDDSLKILNEDLKIKPGKII